MEVSDDLLHTLEREIVWIEGENSSPIHVVWMKKLALGLERLKTVVGTDVSPHGFEGNLGFGVTFDHAGDIDIV